MSRYNMVRNMTLVRAMMIAGVNSNNGDLIDLISFDQEGMVNLRRSLPSLNPIREIDVIRHVRIIEDLGFSDSEFSNVLNLTPAGYDFAAFVSSDSVWEAITAIAGKAQIPIDVYTINKYREYLINESINHVTDDRE